MGSAKSGSFARRASKKGAASGARAAKRERVDRRKEERRAAKDARLGRKRVEKDYAHDTQARREDAQGRLEVERLERIVSRQESQLKNWRPPEPEPEIDVERRNKRRRRDFYDMDTTQWKLRGAARPASEVYALSLGLAGPDEGAMPLGEDLVVKHAGKFSEGPAPCREHLDALLALAAALHESGSSKRALPYYRRCLELDAADALAVRRGLARCLMDAGDAAEARALIDRWPEDRSASLRWSMAAIEFVAWRVLAEDGSSAATADAALDAAYAANPFVCWWLAYRPIFEEVLEYTEEIQNPPVGTVEEAFWYCSHEGSLWADLDGAGDWARSYIAFHGLAPPEAMAPAAAAGAAGEAETEAGDTTEAAETAETMGAAADDMGGGGGSGGGAGSMFAQMFADAVTMALEAEEAASAVQADAEKDDREEEAGSAADEADGMDDADESDGRGSAEDEEDGPRRRSSL